MATQKAMVRDLETGTYSQPMSLAEAIIKGIRDCQMTGGGTVWIHRPECDGQMGDEDCWCEPVPIIVDPLEVN